MDSTIITIIGAVLGSGLLSTIITTCANSHQRKMDRKNGVTEKLDEDNKRIKALEAQNKSLQETNALLIRSVLAMINHEIDGNNIEGLKAMRKSITDYITTKAV